MTVLGSTEIYLRPAQTGFTYICGMTKVFLRKKIAPRIANGHPWVYGNEVEKIEGDVVAGDIVDVYYSAEKYAGRGYINPQSQILVRLLTRKQ